MKISKRQLKRIIREEKRMILTEQRDDRVGAAATAAIEQQARGALLAIGRLGRKRPLRDVQKVRVA